MKRLGSVAMDNLLRQKKWKGRAQRSYPDASCKDAPVLPPLPAPLCECGIPASVTQSMHPETAARAYYKCGDHRPWEQCNFFQWIDGPEMVDECILLFRPHSAKTYEKFQRWLPPPSNPPPMTAEEKKAAIARRMADPPLCNCGDPAQIHRLPVDSPYTPTFECRNRTENGYPVCDFSEYNYGPKSYWPDEETEKMKKPREISPPPKTLCDCGVEANNGLVPSELGIGHYCGHMVGNDVSTRRCGFEFYWDKPTVDHEIAWRSKRAHPGSVLNSYLELRKSRVREEARTKGMLRREGEDPLLGLRLHLQNKKRMKMRFIKR